MTSHWENAVFVTITARDGRCDILVSQADRLLCEARGITPAAAITAAEHHITEGKK